MPVPVGVSTGICDFVRFQEMSEITSLILSPEFDIASWKVCLLMLLAICCPRVVVEYCASPLS